MTTSNLTYKGFLATNKEAKTELKSIGAIRSIILGLESFSATAEGKAIKTFLRSTKKDSAKYDLLANSVQKNKNGQTCIFWVARTALKLAKA